MLNKKSPENKFLRAFLLSIYQSLREYSMPTTPRSNRCIPAEIGFLRFVLFVWRVAF